VIGEKIWSYKPRNELLIKEEIMKTKMNLMLLSVVFVIASMSISCNSVGIAAEEEPPLPPFYVKSQEIVIGGGSVCTDLNPITQCWEKFKDCKTGEELTKLGNPITREEFFGIVSKGVKIKHIVGSSCDSFIVEIEGNTTYCCGRICYVCGR
jgi:hypothetical protein